MKRTYIAPTVEIQHTTLVTIIALSIPVDSSKNTGQQLGREEYDWDIWDDEDEE